jgi:hypothetical protein
VPAPITAPGFAFSAALDAKGKCRDSVSFVASEKCKATAPISQDHCRDIPTKKFASYGAPNTEPVPK